MNAQPLQSAIASLVTLALFTSCAFARGDETWVVYENLGDGPGKGKHIVLVGGDEEYRSEESLPQLGKILAKRHGFKCTVLFAVDPATDDINPEVVDNIPGLAALGAAELMIISTRFRVLPDRQMEHIVQYIDAGKPIIGLRTATHAFNFPEDSRYAKFGWKYPGKDYEKGFGKQILGETWVAHHGAHGKQSTRGILAPGMEDHPIVRGIKDGDIWGPTDVYAVTLPLPDNCKPIVMGEVVEGMNPTDPAAVGAKNAPMMPVAWTKTYQGKTGSVGRVFTTTMGAATDFESEGLRRLVVNAAYWCLNLQDHIPVGGTDVGLVGEYKPTPFGFKGYKKGVKPSEHKM
jgi:hypothetical protein